eukprot:GHVS01037222.1.p1 GENE.GHVS01037222.1~~GHVS01037222.1.p1  ORF type:complete len:229 (-),score=54.61 GHVS01037222.1:107-793(-)
MFITSALNLSRSCSPCSALISPSSSSSSSSSGNGSEEEEEKETCWRIELNVGEDEDFGFLRHRRLLSEEQLCWCVALWTLRMERSERMNRKMIGELLLGAEQQNKRVDINMVFLNEKLFFPLDCVRCIQVRRLEDVMGDLIEMFDLVGPSGTVYAILSRQRVMGMYARKQGEILDIAVFDPQPPDDAASSFVGFDSLDDMMNYTKNIFDEQQQSNSKLTAWVVRSRTS